MKHCGPSTAAFLFGAGVETGWGKAGLARSQQAARRRRQCRTKGRYEALGGRGGGGVVGDTQTRSRDDSVESDGGILHQLASWIGPVVGFAAVYALFLSLSLSLSLSPDWPSLFAVCRVAARRSARQFGLSRA